MEASVVRVSQGAATVEAPSGKDRGDENFPVGSMLLAAAKRPYVHAFYAFARAADDIADDSALTESEKISRLNALEDILLGRRTSGSTNATLLRARLAELQLSNEHPRDLLHAFRQDASKNRYESWAELMGYCRYSAMPVGRFLLDLHGESREIWPHSDALCAVLQVLNHLQDCAGDLATIDRCYIPAEMLARHGAAVSDLRKSAATPQLRAVFDEMLAKCDELNRAAAPLASRIHDRRMRMEAAVICTLARKLTLRLKQGDPLAMRVALKKRDFTLAGLGALRRFF